MSPLSAGKSMVPKSIRHMVSFLILCDCGCFSDCVHITPSTVPQTVRSSEQGPAEQVICLLIPALESYNKH